ncbi:hypothetical protein AUJ13_05110 [Candidatus Micrarchaeota archaeon CG1_02_49_24]|nr:MAG: hypothetical protein AUJ13_05110 [Candidatus Micrarchaeota archaeon CG1_02_49_24]HII53732.1 ATP-binding protein [Candidatus Micrarchaeota archaeon]
MFINRDIDKEFELADRTHKIVALIGPRQAGKTTYLQERMRNVSNAEFVTFDDVDVLEVFDSDIKLFEQRYVAGKTLTIIDEVQYGKGAGQKLKYLADRGYKLWLTSSSQLFLQSKVLSHLVGRVALLDLFPFNWAEFASARNAQPKLTAMEKTRLITEHIVYGGYPKVVLSTDVAEKTEILKNLLETALIKDAINFFGIDKDAELRKLVAYLAYTTGSLVIFDKLSNDLGINFLTLVKYLDILEKSNIIKRVNPYYTNKSLELVKSPKYYFVDTGLRNAVLSEYPASLDNTGGLFENYVFAELLKTGHPVNFWRTKSKAEVDFVISQGQRIIPVEAKLSSQDMRIERSLHSFISRYNPSEAYVVSLNTNEEAPVNVNDTLVWFVNVPELLERLKNAGINK